MQEWDNQDYFGMNLEKSAEYLKAAGYEPGQLEIHLMVSSQAPQGPYQACLLYTSGLRFFHIRYRQIFIAEFLYLLFIGHEWFWHKLPPYKS